MRCTTASLHPGVAVLTQPEPSGDDFGIPLVRKHKPARHSSPPMPRTVRNTCRCRGGVVVWFTDGTKTPPLHGATTWEVAS